MKYGIVAIMPDVIDEEIGVLGFFGYENEPTAEDYIVLNKQMQNDSSWKITKYILAPASEEMIEHFKNDDQNEVDKG